MPILIFIGVCVSVKVQSKLSRFNFSCLSICKVINNLLKYSSIFE
jgi:hypothetical protein